MRELGTDVLPSEADRVAWVAKMHLLQYAKGVRRFIWYMYDNGGWGTLWTFAGGLLPEGVAYGEVYRWMVGATVSGCDRSPNGTWVCSISRTSPAGYQAWAVWNEAGTVAFAQPSGATRYRDLAGNTRSLLLPTVTITTSPILFETQSAW